MIENFRSNQDRVSNVSRNGDTLSEIPDSLKNKFPDFFENLNGLRVSDPDLMERNRDLIVNAVVAEQFNHESYPDSLKELTKSLEGDALAENLAATFKMPREDARNLASMRLSPKMTEAVAGVLNKIREWRGSDLGEISEEVANELEGNPERSIMQAHFEFAQSVLVTATLAEISTSQFLDGSLPRYNELRDFAVEKNLNCSGGAKFRLLEMARDLDNRKVNSDDPAGEFAFLDQIRQEVLALRNDPVIHDMEDPLIDGFLGRLIVKITGRLQEFALARGVGLNEVFIDGGSLNTDGRGQSATNLVRGFGEGVEEFAISDVNADYLGTELRELPRNFAAALVPWDTAVSGMRVATDFAKFLRNRPDPSGADFRQAQDVTFGALDRLAIATQKSAEDVSKLIDNLRMQLSKISNPEGGPQKLIAMRLKASIKELSALLMHNDSPFSERGVAEVVGMRNQMKTAIEESDIAALKRCVGYAVLILGATGGAVLAGRLIARVAVGLFGETVATTGGVALSSIGKLGMTTTNAVRVSTWGTNVLAMSAGGVLGYETTARGLNALAGREEFSTAKNIDDLFDRWGQGVLMMGGVSVFASALGKTFHGMSNIQHPSVAGRLVKGLGKIGDHGMEKVNMIFSPTKWKGGDSTTAKGFFRQWGNEALEEGMETLGQAANQYVGLAGSIANARRGGRLDLGGRNVDLEKVGITVDNDGNLIYLGNENELQANLSQYGVDLGVGDNGMVIIDCTESGGGKFFVEPGMTGLDFNTALERSGLNLDANGEYSVNSIDGLSKLSEALGQNGFVFSRDASGVIQAKHLRTGQELTINIDSTLMLTVKQALGKLRDATQRLMQTLDEFTANPTDAVALKVQTAMATLLLLVTGCSDATTDPNSKMQDDAIRTIFSKIGGDNMFGDILGWVGSWADDLDFLGLMPPILIAASRFVHLPRFGIISWPKSVWKDLTNRPELRNRIAALKKALKVDLEASDSRVAPRDLIRTKVDEIFAVSDTSGGINGIRVGWRIKEILGRPFVDNNNDVAKKIDSSLKKVRDLLKKGDVLTDEELNTLNTEAQIIVEQLERIPNLPLKAKKEVGALKFILASIAMLPWLLNFGYNRYKTRTKIINTPGENVSPDSGESNMEELRKKFDENGGAGGGETGGAGSDNTEVF